MPPWRGEKREPLVNARHNPSPHHGIIRFVCLRLIGAVDLAFWDSMVNINDKPVQHFLADIALRGEAELDV